MLGALLAPPLCWSCSGPAQRRQALCPACRRARRFLPREPVILAAGRVAGGVRVWAPIAYEGPGRDLVRALKFRGAFSLADEMAALVVAAAPNGFLCGALVPVPLQPARLRRRGFNQAAVLAQAIAGRTGLVVVDCLRRRGAGPPQVGRGRQARLAGPAGSIEVHGRAPGRALIVDDVVTTGGTLSACAVALRDAGTAEVAAVAFARTPGR